MSTGLTHLFYTSKLNANLIERIATCNYGLICKATVPLNGKILFYFRYGLLNAIYIQLVVLK